jgi:hypothetical protein
MMSERRIEANRRNAQESTGPRTTEGRARVSRNARKHGLAVSIVLDEKWSSMVERLASALAGENPSAERLQIACYAAEAELEILRARACRALLAEKKIRGPKIMATLKRYEARAWSRRSRMFEILAS